MKGISSQRMKRFMLMPELCFPLRQYKSPFDQQPIPFSGDLSMWQREEVGIARNTKSLNNKLVRGLAREFHINSIDDRR